MCVCVYAYCIALKRYFYNISNLTSFSHAILYLWQYNTCLFINVTNIYYICIIIHIFDSSNYIYSPILSLTIKYLDSTACGDRF